MANGVVVTGMGAVCALGHHAEDIFKAAKAGVCGIAEGSMFDRDQITDMRFVAEVKDFDPSAYITKREARRLDRFCQFAVYAGMQAWEQAGLSEFDPYKAGVIVGSGMGGLNTICEQYDEMMTNGVSAVSSLFITKAIINIAPGNLAIRLGLHGPNYGVVTACASGADAVGQAYRMVKDGIVDIMLVGGAEAVINNLAVQGFNQMQALSNAETVDRASIPFDKERQGFVMGEGAAFVVLESETFAKARGAKVLGQICGYGQTCDANHITAPMEGGVHAAKAMALACEEADISADAVGYINAHGTGTPLNDKTETAAIRACFGAHADAMLVSSTKSMTAHLLGAAGAMEAILTMKSLSEGVALPTINLKVADPECDLDYVANEAKPMNTDYALSNSLGFGGHNSSLLFKRV